MMADERERGEAEGKWPILAGPPRWPAREMGPGSESSEGTGFYRNTQVSPIKNHSDA